MRYGISLCCSIIPKALFNISILGPCLKLLIRGPKAFLVEPLSPAEIAEKFENLTIAGQALHNNCELRSQVNTERFTAISQTMDQMREQIRVLESGGSINSINVPQARTHESSEWHDRN